MKLAEALLIRADMQKKLASLKARIAANVKVQEGDHPSEDPQALMVAAQQVIGELAVLIGRIHRTNATAPVRSGQTMLDLLVERDALADRHQVVQLAIEHTKANDERYSYREIKWQTVIPVASLQKQADDLAAKLRQLNIEIQGANWQIELLD